MTAVATAGMAVKSSTVELSWVSHWYGNVVAVNDISLTIGPA
jgi:ABC-2 type transport system ATP-binding protein